MKRNFTTALLRLFSFGMFLLLGSSCQKEFEKKAPVVVNDTAFNSPKERKVLLLIVDGLRGVALKEIGPPNITNLLKKSTYSYYSLSDEAYDESTSWADLFTGVSLSKHGVTNGTFSHNKFDLYPPVFRRIKEINPNFRIATFSYSNNFTDNLTNPSSVDLKATYASDAETQGALLQELTNENAGLVLAMYKNVNAAGSTGSYESSDQKYRNEIIQFDNYVGQAISSLKNRRNYNKENWLVIVTSSRGGNASVVNDNTIFSNPKMNTFTLIYNDKYQSKLIDKPFTGNVYEGSFVRLYSPTGAVGANQEATAIRAELRFSDELKSSTLNPLNFNGSDFTIEIKVRKNLNTIGTQGGTGSRNTFKYQWPMFFGKKTTKRFGSTGWGFAWENDTWRFSIWNSSSSLVLNSTVATTPMDLNWHSLVASIKTEGAQRYLRTYYDGTLIGKVEVTAAFLNAIDNYNAPITMGYIPEDNNDPFDGNISDVKIWRTALPDDIIKQYASDVFLSSSHPFYNYLAGYWPCRDGAGGKFRNEAITDGNFDFKILKGGSPLVKGTELGSATVWEKSTYVVCPTPIANISTTVPNSKDITPQILSWLGIAVKDSWNLDGRVFLNN
ncbi:LamG-like jellyroll fold domain-containing protein [Mucilaginibacter terrae]|uniref:DUF4983 domain-containing protein n=1 Tax=Mucilaginibacter terrae TaxID=1955052 RepID=A0ABU3GN08_9SPHI|nr:LamG-like jellyroll fold domain-containing protein [Mucilaginibacter terrae]MDT3401154.1 hypothetical protein [Mucilaginibacter terrae]